MPIPSTLHAVDQGRGQADDLYLLVLGPSTFASRRLPRSGRVVIGRADDVDLKLTDPLSSRRHACITVSPGELYVEDLGSANGTRVRDARIETGQAVAIGFGESITIGSTVLIVRASPPAALPLGLCEHEQFEERLRAHCAAQRETGVAPTVIRLRLEGTPRDPSDQDPVVEAAAGVLGPADVVASYLDDEYEILLAGASRESAAQVLATLSDRLNGRGLRAVSGIAHFPQHGRSADKLLRSAGALLRGGAAASGAASGAIVADDTAMKHVLEVARKAAAAGANVLILGETGVGKNVIAEAIHRMSPRAKGPFIAQNSGALPESLVESELFGHEKGAFSGAIAAKAGLFELAQGGTFFLDEIGELSQAVQVKLLHALQSRTIRRVGGVRDIPIDVRFIAATNRDLEAEVAEGRFREDLYYRINVLSLHIPPLRERVRDIAPLARAFVAQICRREGRSPEPVLMPDTLVLLERYAWPGNVRQLENAMERAVALGDGQRITADDLPENMMARQGDAPQSTVAPPMLQAGDDERNRIATALIACHGNQTRAAKMLGLSRIKLNRQMVKHGIPRLRDN